MGKALVLRETEQPPSRSKRPELAAQPNRPLRAQELGSKKTPTLSRSRPSDSHTPSLPRPYGPSTSTPDEIKGFLEDKKPDAYERLVDHLLASDGYAERMTLVWMDAARYGDTSVFHDDGPRTMWPWRDWVLDAYKQNMPFDQFTVEQLAGDLLPESTVEQKIASGFNRNHATTDEGGVIAEEFRVEYVVDRVKTTANAWMGLTMECAQCHSHMYDPISQEEYYGFYAFYNNNADPGMQTRRGNQAPVVNVESSEQKEKKAELEKKNQEISNKQDARRKEARKAFEEWSEEQFLAAGEKKAPLRPQG